jgi:uncharacterized protein (DUF58 family)
MKSLRSARMRRFFYPDIGGKARKQKIGNIKLPFLNWIHFVTFGCITPRLLAITLLGVIPFGVLFFSGFTAEMVKLNFILISAIISAVLLGRFMRPDASFTLEAPIRVEKGRRFTVNYRVKNESSRTALDLCVEVMRFPILTDEGINKAKISNLAPKESINLESTGLVPSRGLYKLPPLRCTTDFPSGLWKWGKTDWTERFLHVYPAYTRLVSFKLPEDSFDQFEMYSTRQITRSATEFYGCREFRQGDSLRNVHVRSSARLGYPVIKEYQAEGRGSTVFVVEACRRSRIPESGFFPDRALEATLSLVAAATDFISRTERTLELLAINTDIYRFRNEFQGDYFENVLDLLSSVEGKRGDIMSELPLSFFDEFISTESVCLFFNNWDKHRVELIRTFENMGIKTKVIVVVPPKFVRPPEMPADVICADYQSVEKGEVTAL